MHYYKKKTPVQRNNIKNTKSNIIIILSGGLFTSCKCSLFAIIAHQFANSLRLFDSKQQQQQQKCNNNKNNN